MLYYYLTSLGMKSVQAKTEIARENFESGLKSFKDPVSVSGQKRASVHRPLDLRLAVMVVNHSTTRDKA